MCVNESRQHQSTPNINDGVGLITMGGRIVPDPSDDAICYQQSGRRCRGEEILRGVDHGPGDEQAPVGLPIRWLKLSVHKPSPRPRLRPITKR